MTNKPWAGTDPFTNLLSLKMIGNIFKCVWVVAYGLLTHFLCLQVIGNIPQDVWVFFYCFFKHLLSFITVRDMPQKPWVFFNSLITHFLCFKNIRDKWLEAWLFTHFLVELFLNHPPHHRSIFHYITQSIIPNYLFKRVNHFIYTIKVMQWLKFMDRKNFLYPKTRYKKAYVYAHIFSVSFFHLLTYTNLTTLMDSKQ